MTLSARASSFFVHKFYRNYVNNRTEFDAMGQAYAFLYYKGKTEDIVFELANLKNMVGSPSELELSVDELKHFMTVNINLRLQAEKAQRMRLNQVISGGLPNLGNRAAATELAAIINSLYNTSLYSPDEPFYTAIVYQRGDTFVQRRE